MESMKTRGLSLLAVAATAGIVVTALATTASAATSGTPRPSAACVEAAGKYAGHVITSYDITGGDDSTQGVPGGTLQVWGSEKCRTLWTKTVKLPEYIEGGFVGPYQFNTAETFRY